MTEVILEAVVVVALLTKPRALGWILFITLSIPSIILANSSNASVITPIPLYGGGIIILLQPPPIEFPPNTLSRLDIYGDLLCPDYRDFVENVESKILEKYKSTNLLVTLHLFPLPYHHTSYVVNQAALGLTLHYSRNGTSSNVSGNDRPGEVLKTFRKAIFKVQESLGNREIINTTMGEIQQRVGDIASSVGLSCEVAMSSMSDHSVDSMLRTSLKQAWFRGVTASPSLYLNSAPLYLSGTDTWTVRLLSNVIDSCHIRSNTVDFV
jgi:hypothetical protein